MGWDRFGHFPILILLRQFISQTWGFRLGGRYLRGVIVILGTFLFHCPLKHSDHTGSGSGLIYLCLLLNFLTLNSASTMYWGWVLRTSFHSPNFSRVPRSAPISSRTLLVFLRAGLLPYDTSSISWYRAWEPLQ